MHIKQLLSHNGSLVVLDHNGGIWKRSNYYKPNSGEVIGQYWEYIDPPKLLNEKVESPEKGEN